MFKSYMFVLNVFFIVILPAFCINNIINDFMLISKDKHEYFNGKWLSFSRCHKYAYKMCKETFVNHAMLTI